LKLWDMHVHTLWSDGSTPVCDVIGYAAKAGLAGIAVTDHDSMGKVSEAQAYAKQFNIDIVPGVEISSMDYATGRKVHILVYYPKKTDVLQPHFDGISEQRRRAGFEMTKLIQKHFPISVEQVLHYSKDSGTIYRPHIMRALMDRGYAECIYGKRYHELFGSNGSCRVKVIYPDVFEAAELARRSGGVVFAAHPDVYDSYDAIESLDLKRLIDGIEMRYPRKKPENEAKHIELIKKYSLLTSGGTDYHGWYTPDPNPIGCCTTCEEEIIKIKELIDKRR